ncbi:hypothetical protein SAMD00019534_109570 [Acytostelium subglobosum LB1]|uniref:hypothetical protein n=1 Tax=Acytostelium subglobosum LB1 TaxID=1410327 RepID=UPI000644A2A5|nr:hypothetical protein SAMD00019534_109570 [Acytostelium subglobosum LB1]GAM27781.1 hypothetical protein SAMD00019534_109570 [Acytostelium subglobosum LB1]|eukprot:XP_012749440.1 hypothetical protein SAMD00019534_109570 [Acytostelium subglobosum LB1]
MELLQRLASYGNILFGWEMLLSPGLTLDTLEFIKANLIGSRTYLDPNRFKRMPELFLVKDITLLKDVFELITLDLGDMMVRALIRRRPDVFTVLAETGCRVGPGALSSLHSVENVHVLIDSGCLEQEPTQYYNNILKIIIERYYDISLVRDFHNKYGRVYAHTNESNSSSTPVMEYAARHGNLEIVRFLHQNLP